MSSIRNVLIGILVFSFIMAGFTILLNLNYVDEDGVYGTEALHADEEDFDSYKGSLITPADEIQNKSSGLQDVLSKKV